MTNVIQGNKYVIKVSRMNAGSNKTEFNKNNNGKKRETIRQFIVINEERLISLVQARPILYDKALKGYRKPTVREQAWQEVAKALSSTVEESKKRWRSLRDAFMKQYKLFSNDDPLLKKKKWLFYDQMEFLGPYLEINYGSVNSTRDGCDTENATKNEEYLYKTEYCDNDNSNKSTNDEYCVMETSDSSEEILFESDTVEHIEDCDDPAVVEINDEEIIDIYEDSENISDIFPKTISFPLNDNDENLSSIEASQNGDDNNDSQQENQDTKDLSPIKAAELASTDSITKSTNTQSSPSNSLHNVAQSSLNCNVNKVQQQASSFSEDALSSKNQTDPDEKFLLSCAPILRRLGDKKNGLARLRIQQVLYEIEFGQL